MIIWKSWMILMVGLFCFSPSFAWPQLNDGDVVSEDSVADDSADAIDLTSLPLEELLQIRIEASSFFDQSLQRTPGTVWQISSTELEHSPATSLSDFFHLYVPGVHMGFQEQYGTLYATRGIQSDSNAKTLVLLDGQGLNQRNHWGYNAGFLLPLLGDLQHIEVTNGPGAILHGSGAINGFVNLVPKTGENHPGLYARAEYGFIDTLARGELGYGWTYGTDRHVYLYGGGVWAEGFEPSQDYGASQDPSAMGSRANRPGLKVQGFPEPSIKFATYWTHGNVNLNVLYHRVNFYPNTLIRRFDEDASWHESLLAIRPKYSAQLSSSETLTLIPSLELFDHGAEGRDDNNIVVSSVGNPPKQSAGGSEKHYEGKVVFTSTRFNSHSFAIGGLYGYRDFRSRKHFLSPDPGDSFFASIDTDWSEWAVFAENIMEVTDALTLSLGIRFDRVSYGEIRAPFLTVNGVNNVMTPKDVSNIAPRAALAYQATDDTTVKLSYQEGFHYPDAVNFVEWAQFNSDLAILGAEPLPSPKPETVKSVELNIHSLFPDQGFSAMINLYYNFYEDFLHFHDFENGGEYSQATIDAIVNGQCTPSPCPTPQRFYFGAFANGHESFASTGGELTLRWYPLLGAQVQFSYGYSRPVNMSKQANQSVQLANPDRKGWALFPTHQVKAMISYATGPWRLNLSGIVQSAVNTNRPGVTKSQRHSIYDDPHARLNAIIEYEFMEGMTFYVLGKNILGNETPPVSFVPQSPFNGGLGQNEPLVYIGVKGHLW